MLKKGRSLCVGRHYARDSGARRCGACADSVAKVLNKVPSRSFR